MMTVSPCRLRKSEVSSSWDCQAELGWEPAGTGSTTGLVTAHQAHNVEAKVKPGSQVSKTRSGSAKYRDYSLAKARI